MKLKTTKSVIELLKQFNHYATVKTEPELNDHEAKRNYKIYKSPGQSLFL